MAYIPYIIGGIAAPVIIVIEVRRAFQPGSAVRQVLDL